MVKGCRLLKDLYKLLGLSRGASQDDIRKAHRKLVRTYHPDANPEDPQAEERFKEIQRAYEILSNPEKRREYDKRFRTSSREASSRPRAKAGGRSGGGATYTVDLSDLLGKLANLSGDRAGDQKEGGFRLQGEDVARIAELLGMEISRISELLREDTVHFSKHLGENMRMNAKASFGDVRTDRFSPTDEGTAGGKPSEVNDEPREKKVKGPRARRKEKRVKGPRAQRNEKPFD